MLLYSRHVPPRLIEAYCSVKPVRKQREKIVPLAEGVVREVGVGSGLNFPDLDRTRVDRVFGLDVASELMGNASEQADRAGIEFEPVILDAAEIPLEARAVDTVWLHIRCAASMRLMRHWLRCAGYCSQTASWSLVSMAQHPTLRSYTGSGV